MGDYTSLFAGSVMIDDEGTYPGKMQVMIESDSLGKVTIKLGNSMTLRLDSESAGNLAELIIEHSLNVRLQTQLHKVIWGNINGR